MIDLETLDNLPGAAILSIGAAFFDPYENYDKVFPDDIPLFYRNVDLDSCLSKGMTVSGSTFHWWMDQGAEAKKALTEPKPERIERVVWDFNKFYWDQRDVLATEQNIDKKKVDIYLWSHGATFDIPILNVATVKCGKRIPWRYPNCRDTRTIFDLAFNEGKGKFEGLGTKHNAVHDALTQIIWVQEAYVALGKVKVDDPDSWNNG